LLKTSIQKKEEQLSQAFQINEQLQKSINQGELLFQHTKEEFEQHVLLLKQEYFFANALAIKLSLFHQDFISNKSIQQMWERVAEEHIPFTDWRKTITRWFITDC